mmetsp:Transcript_15275/g.25496  ORF Transcript_15275/g.25496 Transcript_15275/m.25496 type:complete len:885 (+) Transcript_15275:20-2674(+)
MLHELYCLILFLFFIAGSAATSSSRQPVLVLDLDGTIYDDDCNIEQQIRVNYRRFALETYNVSKDECTAMRAKYGSTVRGLSVKFNSKEAFTKYYNNVYPQLDMSRLRKYLSKPSSSNTGYYLSGMRAAHRALFDIKDCPVVIASNSPVFHVKRVLSRIGLANLKVDAFITPERTAGAMKTETAYWQNLFDLYPKDKYLCTLIDDNAENIELVRKLGMVGLRIEPGATFTECLVEFLLQLGKHTDGYKFDENQYLRAKNAVDAQSFNKDVWTALRTSLSHRIATSATTPATAPATQSVEESRKAAGEVKRIVRVLDIGAGHLNMLQRVLSLLTDAPINTSPPPPTNNPSTSSSSSMPSSLGLHYIAVENNQRVHKDAIHTLTGILGLKATDITVSEAEADAAAVASAVQRYEGKVDGINVTVDLCDIDFMSLEAVQVLKILRQKGYTPTWAQVPAHALLQKLNDADGDNSDGGGGCVGEEEEEKDDSRVSAGLDLVVGACVADLHEPGALLNQIVDIADDSGGLLYLPITFAGATALKVPDPALEAASNRQCVRETNNHASTSSGSGSWLSAFLHLFSGSTSSSDSRSRKSLQDGNVDLTPDSDLYPADLQASVPKLKRKIQFGKWPISSSSSSSSTEGAGAGANTPAVLGPVDGTGDVGDATACASASALKGAMKKPTTGSGAGAGAGARKPQAVKWADQNGGLLREIRTIEVEKIKRSTAHYSSTRDLSKRERQQEKEVHASKAEETMQKTTDWRTPKSLSLSIVVLDNIGAVAESAERETQERRLATVLEVRYLDDSLIPLEPDEAASAKEDSSFSSIGGSSGERDIPWYQPGTEPSPLEAEEFSLRARERQGQGMIAAGGGGGGGGGHQRNYFNSPLSQF